MKLLMSLLMLAVPFGGTAQAQETEEQAKVRAFCNLNSSSPLCTARLRGNAIKSGGVDLAAAVAKGEGYGTSAITADESDDCWAIWSALRDHVARNGRGTLPADYTVLALTKRVVEWDKTITALYISAADDDAAAGKRDVARSKAERLPKFAADVAGPRIINVSESSGMCKRLPKAG